VTSSDGSLQDAGTIPVNGSRNFTDVAAGITVQALLGGLPVNCTLSGQNPQTVATQSGQQATLSFQVSCVAVVGAVQVLTVTTGTELDGDGYTVTVAGTAEAIGVNDSETFSGLPVGDYPVELSNVDASCSLAGENPRTLSVAFGQTAQTTFQITCPVLLEVQTQTVGQDLDPDGYSLTVDQAAAGAIATNGTSSFGLLPGLHSVQLTGVATNCAVTGENPRSVTLQTSAGATVLFEIGCEANQGSITVQTATTGWDVPAAYGLTVDLQAQGNVGANALVEIPGFASGARSVQLTGVPANCSVQGANPQLVNVVVGQTVQAGFILACGGIAFESDRNGNPRMDIFVANSDGSAPPTQISGFLPTNMDPAWHPNRSMIGYACQLGVSLEICIQNVDQPGVLPTLLMTDNFMDTDPAWSPDGTKIAFRSNRDGDREIFVMNADGTGLLQLTNNLADDQDPSWSPDGQQIVFHSNRGGDRELYIMNADGSSGENPFQLTGNATNEEDPAWSPDGTTIAFVSDRHGAREIFLAAADGSSGQNWVRLTINGADEENPAWSPDGLRIAFTSDRDGDDEIYVMMADGSSGENPFQLTNNTAKDDEAGWRD
jgi:Tol biopolymer transport system component